MPTATIEMQASQLQAGFHGVAGVDGQRLNPDIQDALDAQGVADELLEDWKMREDQALSGSASANSDGPPVLPAHVRQAALRFLSHTAQLAGLPQKSWFEAATLLDFYVLKTMDAERLIPTINALPSTCVSLVAILKKNDCATALVAGSSFVPHACLFAQYLHRLGFPSVNSEVTDEMINIQERIVLQALGWRVHMPTTESWTSTYSARFNVLTRSLLVPSLNWVWQQGLFGARLIMMRQASTSELPPRVLAAGLLGLGLVGARLLPLEAIRPPKMSSEEWNRLYEEIQPLLPQPQCVLPPNHSQCLLELLSVTVGVDLQDIKEYGRLASIAMRDALKEAQELEKVRCDPEPQGPSSVPEVYTARHATI
jgi:hypothetical protein